MYNRLQSCRSRFLSFRPVSLKHRNIVFETRQKLIIRNDGDVLYTLRQNPIIVSLFSRFELSTVTGEDYSSRPYRPDLQAVFIFQVRPDRILMSVNVMKIIFGLNNRLRHFDVEVEVAAASVFLQDCRVRFLYF